MIEFLDQLERDLVEAIDRRGRAPRRRRPRLRLDLVAAAAALAAGVLLVVVLGSPHETENKAVKHPTTPTVTNPKPIPQGTPLKISGGVRRTGPTTWSGPAKGPGGGGVLTLTGQVDMRQRPCCDTPQSVGPKAAHVLQFRWTSSRGVLGGCVVNTIYRRPHARFVWDGPGLVKVATGGLARYRGRAIGIGGVSDIGLTSRAHIGLAGGAPRPPGRC
jgi:hypothetical protein